jgi:hypothetical protein
MRTIMRVPPRKLTKRKRKKLYDRSTVLLVEAQKAGANISKNCLYESTFNKLNSDTKFFSKHDMEPFSYMFDRADHPLMFLFPNIPHELFDAVEIPLIQMIRTMLFRINKMGD